MQAREQEEAAREALRRSLSLSLRSKEKDWYRPTLTRAKALAAAMYRDIFGGRIPDDTRAAIAGYVEKALRDTKRDPDGRDAQVERLARGIAAYLASAVLDSNTPSDQWEKVWRSEHDDKVRPSHAEADGQVVDGDGFFTVGGVKMFAPGDISAPAEEWAGCRCHPEYRRRTTMPVPDAMVAAADPEHAFVIVGLPADEDPLWEVSSEQPPHVTMLYLSTDFLEQARQILAGEAEKGEPTVVEVTEVGELGDEGAQVAFLDPLGLAEIREALLGYEPIQQAYDALADEQFPEWTPHTTLGYPETPPLSAEVPATITIDRLAILVDGLDSTYALGEPMAEPTDMQPEVGPDEVVEDDVDEFPTNGTYDEVPLYGVLAPEGAPTGDKRGMLEESLTWTDPPLTLRWMEIDDEGHKGSVPTGRAAMTPKADEMVGLIAEGVLRGISVDLDDMTMELRSKDGSEVSLPEADENGEIAVSDVVFDDLAQWTVAGRIRSAAVLPIPAFPESFTAIGTWAEHDAMKNGAEQPQEDVPEELVASAVAESREDLADALVAAPGTEDGPGWLTHPVDTDRLRDYWVRGKGAAKIGWGLPGDFNRCRAMVAEYVKPQHLAGYCANRHKDALGFWPGEHRGGKHSTAVEPFNLVASAGTLKPPREWFEDPQLVEGSGSMTIVERDPHTGLRRTFGWAAEWDTCHTGFADRCVAPPSSPSDYAHFHLGYVELDDGSNLPIGTLTMGTGHADLTLSAAATLAHYDNTGTAFAHVRLGENERGIWYAGVILPHITDEEVFAIRGAKISGDWRNVAGQGLDAIAMLAVNTPGFPVVRTALAASAGQRQALVAAGVVDTPALDEDALQRIVAAAVSERLSVIQAREAMRAAQKIRRRATMASIAASAAARKGA
jgi:hypothetical protein